MKTRPALRGRRASAAGPPARPGMRWLWLPGLALALLLAPARAATRAPQTLAPFRDSGPSSAPPSLPAQAAEPSGPAPASSSHLDQAGGPTGAEGAFEARVEPQVEPYAGRYSEGMHELMRLARAQEFEPALELADALLSPNAFSRFRTKAESWSHGVSEPLFSKLDAPLAWLGFEAMTPAQRGEVQYAKGLIHGGAGHFQAATDALQLARAETGPGETRLDAIYALGTLKLLAGEAIRSTIPEIAGQAPGAAGAPGQAGPAGMTPMAGPAAGAPGEDGPDPIELARAAYTLAKDHFVERLRAEWRDADTRANLELCLRRLKELDEIERKRQEEEDQQKQQQEQDQDQQKQDKQDSEDKPEPDDKKDEQQQEDKDKQEEPESQDQQDSQDQQTDEEKQDDAEQRQKPKELNLTEEEMKRLFDHLKELEQERDEKTRRLREWRRVPVRRDY